MSCLDVSREKSEQETIIGNSIYKLTANKISTQDSSALTSDHSDIVSGSASKIENFYNNRSVLITGATGFIGKVLIEKLSRSCPGIRNIFLLIRPKRQQQAKDRLEDLLRAPLFDWLRDHKLEHKIVLVEGDVTLTNFGLSDENLSRIINEVSVIYHSAATIKFDELLKLAVGINIIGVKNLVDLARQLTNLAAIVHISTAYANCDLETIDEHVYPVPLDPEKLIAMSEWLDQDTLQELKMKLLKSKPNTYTYTKSLAEYLLVKIANDLPVVICRPSIVVASWKEPVSGWIDNVNGPTGIILGSAKGLIRSMYADETCVADLIPVDTVINLIITLGWFANSYAKHKQYFNCNRSIAISEDQSCDVESLDRNSNQSDRNSDIDCEHNDSDSDARVIEENGKSSLLVVPGKAIDGRPMMDEGYGSGARSHYSNSSVSICSSASSLNNASQAGYEYESTNFQSFGARKKLVDQQNFELDLKIKQFRSETKAKLTAKDLPEEFADVPVFHCTSGAKNPITWGYIRYIVLYTLTIFPSISTIRYPGGSFTKNRLLDNFYKITLHYIPGYLIDFLTRISGGKPILVKIYGKFDQAANVLEAFTTKQWVFSTDNINFLNEELLSEHDKKLFNFSIEDLDWKNYMRGYILGVREFLLKEPMKNIEQARRNLKITYLRNLLLQLLSICTVIYCGRGLIVS